MAVATGIFKKVAYKRETTWGTLAGTNGATYLRRVQSALDLSRAPFQSNELRASQQISDLRLGLKQVGGQLSGELSPGAYSDIMSAVLRRDFTTGSTTGSITTVTAAAGDGSTTYGTFTRSAGSYLTDGFKIGDVVRWTGWTTTGTANNARNYRITDLTATVMTVGSIATGAIGGAEAVASKASGDSVTCTVAGKKTYVPTSGHTTTSYTLEHWFSDISQSEVFTGCVPTGFDLQIPANGLATIGVRWLGKDMNPTGASITTQYFTTPTAAPTFGALAGVNGLLRVGGVDYAIITAASISVTGNHSVEAVVGSLTTPAVFPGKVTVSGQMSVFFLDNVIRDSFLNETDISAQLMLTTSSGSPADFVNIYIPRLKLTGSSKNDNEKAIVQNFSFAGLENTSGGTGTSSEDTVISIQDTQAS